MARGDSVGRKDGSSSTGSRARSPHFSDRSFVNYELDKTQAAECKAWNLSEEETFSVLQAEVDNGYKFTLKRDTDNPTYSVFMQASEVGGPNEPGILTGRGSSLAKAVKQVLYKHSVCFEGSWGHLAGRNSNATLDD